MGGRALKQFGIETERKSTVEHERILSELKPRVEKLFNCEVKTVKYYHTKDSHGDLDLLVLSNNKNPYELIKKEFNTTNINSNGSVYSFEYDDYQIDIILISEKKCNTEYFSYDPCGNLFGKIAHKFGLKYGTNGLVYPFRNFSGRITKDIVLSTDTRKMFTFLGFNYNRYMKGFDTVEEIFDFVINSDYFDDEIFLFKNLTATDRKRNEKRATYNGFLTYVKNNNIKSSYSFEKDKNKYFDFINNYFPESNFLKKLDELHRLDEESKLISGKFNGKLIMEKYPELKGKELGSMIKLFKEKYDSNFILNNSVEEIMDKFNILYNG